MAVEILSVIVVFLGALTVYPLIRRRWPNQFMAMATDDTELFKRVIMHEANQMLISKRVRMSFSDDYSLYALLSGVKDRVLGRNAYRTYTHFNFPVGFLLIGLLDFYTLSKDPAVLRRIEKKCDSLLDASGNLSFEFNKIDQAVFGLVFLGLYNVTHSERYLSGARRVHEQVLRFRGADGLYRYRLGINVFFIDTIGLLCPFLVRYAEVVGCASALADAEKQADFALTRGVESGQGLVFHAFDLEREQPLGSVNWARGMGWFVLGLSELGRAKSNPRILEALRRSATVLDDLRERNGFWPQFLGHTNDKQIDSSATLMFLYAFQRCGIWSTDEEDLKKLVAQCVDRRGKVVRASGDTIYLNKYSRAKGPSELSQGLMLSLIAGITR